MPTPEQPYIMIRKLNNSLRPRLYKMLSDELILLPNHIPRNQHSDQTAPTTRSKSKRNKIKLGETKPTPSFSVQIPKKKPWKHGWLESEQHFEENFTLPFHSHDSDVLPTQQETSEDHISSSTNSSEEELQWDMTPEQYELSETRTPDAWTSTPFVSAPSKIPPAFPRSRVDAFNQPPLQRRCAFRLPTNDRAFIATPSKPSRLPIPKSPTGVDCNAVNELSHILPMGSETGLRRSPRLTGKPPEPQRDDRRREKKREIGHANNSK